MPDLHNAAARERSLRAYLLERFPELDEPEHAETLTDTLEGLSTLEDEIAAALRHVVEREAMAAALSEMIEKLVSRENRHRDAATKIKNAVLAIMQETGRKKIVRPDMTISIGIAAPKVIITDVGALPHWATRPTPRKQDIRDVLKAGEDVPGAALGNAEPYLRVNRR